MTSSIPAPISDPIAQLTSQLQTGSDKSRQMTIGKLLVAGGYGAVLDFLAQASQDVGEPTWLMGYAYRELWKLAEDGITAQLDAIFPTGLVPMESALGLNYGEIQLLLLQEDYEEADRLTFAKMCELAGPTAVKRKWFYFSEVPQFPIADLQTLDRLWMVYSEGKFGFRVQQSIWLGVNQVWEEFWPKIGWKQGLTWTRYPGAFTWDLSAPRGHLPLTNQLRGVRAMDALMNHPAFAQG